MMTEPIINTSDATMLLGNCGNVVLSRKMGHTNIFSYFAGLQNRRIIFLVVAVVVAALVIDTSLTRIYSYYSTNQPFSNVRIGIFAVIALIYVVTQYLILEFVKGRSREIGSKEQLHLR